MLYLFWGIISGIILSLLPVFSPSSAIEVYPEWYGNIQSIENIENSANPMMSKVKLKPVTVNSDIYLLSGNGKLLRKINAGDHLASASQSGKYYVQYEKMGTYVELLNIEGDRFWRIKSREYPYISHNGEIILLMNGDHSGIRIFDIDGNAAGAKEIFGRLCTVISFSRYSDYSGLGFLDGSYYILNEKGEIISTGTMNNSVIKGIAISSNGRFFIVHYGDSKKDFINLTDIHENDSFTFPLRNIHLTRTAIMAADNGNAAVIDYDRIITIRNNEIISVMKTPPKSPGLSSIDFSSDVYSAAYMGIDGSAIFLIYLENGTILYHKVFAEESFIESCMYGNIILLRGSRNLYCYSFHVPGS